MDHDMLMAAIQNDLDNVAIEIGEKIQELIKERVQEIVYDPYPPPGLGRIVKYQRLGENRGFLGSWTYDVEYTGTGDHIIKIYSDADSMDLDSEHFIHGASGQGGQTQGLFGQEVIEGE